MKRRDGDIAGEGKRYGSKIDLSKMRSLNSWQILEAVRREGPISRAELAKRSRLSPPTVSALVDTLLELKLVREQKSPTANSGPGRKPRLLEFNERVGCVAGLEFQPARLRLAVADLNGESISRRERPIASSDGPDRHIEAMAESVADLMEQAGLPPDSLLGLAIAAPGITDSARGEAVDLTMNYLRGWVGIPLASRLQALIGAPVAVENDLNAAAVGEHWRGCARSEGDFAFISANIFADPCQVGAGIVLNGRLHRGGHWQAGEIGRLNVDYHRWKGLDNQLGERLSRQPGSADLEALAECGVEPGANGALEPAAVFNAARDGCGEARRLVEQLAAYLGTAAGNLCTILDPTLLVFGGGIAAAGEGILEHIQGVVSDMISSPPRMALSALGPDVYLAGCIRRALWLAREELHGYVLDPESGPLFEYLNQASQA